MKLEKTTIIKYLLKHGADILFIDNALKSALIYAIESENLEIITTLMQNYININLEDSNSNLSTQDAINLQNNITSANDSLEIKITGEGDEIFVETIEIN